MIIIKTKNGDHFINEKAVTEVTHDREHATASYYGANGCFNNIADVEGIMYTSDAQPIEYKNEGLEIEKLKAELEKEKREKEQICEHSLFMREWFFIYQEAFDKIHDDCKRAEREHPGIYTNPAAIIEQAEKKYAESQKRFEKVREKWDKKEKE